MGKAAEDDCGLQPYIFLKHKRYISSAVMASIAKAQEKLLDNQLPSCRASIFIPPDMKAMASFSFMDLIRSKLVGL